MEPLPSQQTKTVEVSVLPPPEPARLPKLFGWLSLVFALPTLALLTCLPAADVWTLRYGGMRLKTRNEGGRRTTRVEIDDRDLHPLFKVILRPRHGIAPNPTQSQPGRRRFINIALTKLPSELGVHGREAHRLGQIMVVGFLVLGLMLFFTGIGQLRGGRWGRYLATLWGLCGLCFALLMLFFLLPEYGRHCQRLAEGLLQNYRAAQRVCPPFDIRTVAAFGALLTLYPLLTLLYFVSARARRAMP